MEFLFHLQQGNVKLKSGGAGLLSRDAAARTLELEAGPLNAGAPGMCPSTGRNAR
jgi:hypothetical protein